MSKPKPPAFFAMFAAADASRFGDEVATPKPVVPPWERFERPIQVDLLALARRNLRKGQA